MTITTDFLTNYVYWPATFARELMAPSFAPGHAGVWVNHSTRSQSQQPTEKHPGAIRVVCISDTHTKHRKITVAEGDVLIHAGDILFSDRGMNSKWPQNGGHGEQLDEFNDWLGTLPHKHKIVIGGNHDRVLEELGPKAASARLSNAVYLCETETIVDGLRVFGHPGSIPSGSQNTAFQPPKHDRQARDTMGVAIPAGLDILVTHGPAKQFGRSVALADPRLHVHGHLHAGHGVGVLRDGILSVNASVLDNKYRPVHGAVVIDIVPKSRSP